MTAPAFEPTAYHRLAKNSVWVALSNVSMMFVLALTVVASRVLGDAAFGQYVFLLAVTTILADLSVLGTTDYASILIARDERNADTILGNALGMRVPLSLLFLLASLTIVGVRMPEALLPGLLIALDWVARTIIHLLRGVLRAKDAFRADAIVATLERLVVLILATAALFYTRSLVGFAAGILVGRSLAVEICRRAVAATGVTARFEFRREEWARLLRRGVPIGVRGILKGISFRVDAIVLGFMRTAPEVGWYGAAYKFLEASFFFQEAVGVAAQPAISQAWGSGRRQELQEIFFRSYKALQLLGGMLAGAMFVYAGPLIELVFGPEYAEAAGTLRILAWAMLLTFSSLSCLVLLDAIDSGARTVVPFAVAAVLNLALNVLLIPRHGIEGAAAATLVTEALLAGMLLLVVARHDVRIPASAIIGSWISAFALVVACVAVGSLLPQWVAMLAGLLAFGFAILATRVLDATDLAYARFLLQRRLSRSI